MKKCLYCAEEIHEEAIICRYCGRDLREPVSSIESTEPAQPEFSNLVQKSIWQASRTAVIVITILYVLSVFVNFLNFPSLGELVGDLTIGLLATFFGWWAICAFIVWMWRKLGAGGFLLVGSVTLIIAAIIWNNNSADSFSPPPTATRAPTRVPTRTPIPTESQQTTSSLRASNCTWWYNITTDDIGETMCVQGTVDSITGNTETSAMTRIYFRDLPALFYFADDGYYYSELAVGDCVSSTGRISINQDGGLFMRLDGNLQRCP